MKLISFLVLAIFISYAVSQLATGPVTAAKVGDEQDPERDKKSYLYKGWLRFFTFIPNFKTGKRPTKFEQNPFFYEQYTFGRNATFDPQKDKDKFGWFDIIDDTHFFFILTPKTLYAVSARRNDMAKTVKSLELEWLEAIEVDSLTNSYKGGIEDIGNYKEGFCFRLKAKTGINWDLCADSLVEKNEWMRFIKEVYPAPLVGKGASTLIQPEIQLPIEFGVNAQPPLPETGKGQELLVKNGSRVNGRWVILQDWSQCTQACGGGKQYLQRMCIPPQNGGDPCQGQNIMSRPCNMKPCPNIITHQSEGPNLPTVVKMQPISNRLQRFETCVIKEGDLDLMLEMPNLERSPRFPVRVVLNNRTITVFTTPSYDSVYKSFDLQYISIKAHPQDPNACLVLEDQRDAKNKRVGLCIMPLALKPGESLTKARDDWIADIRFFKEKCKPKPMFVNVEDPILKSRKQEIEIEEKDAAFQRVKEKDEENQEKALEGKVEKTAVIAMQAMEKELKYEQLVMKEELQREKDDDITLSQELQKEKQKEECLEREMKKKEKMKSLQKQSLELASKINDIQKAATLQVQSARAKSNERIQAMKRASERRRRDTKRQIQEIRTKIASKLMEEEKSGNVTLCNPHRPESEKIAYCDENFKDYPQKSADCRSTPLDFCYVCCENEFGRMHEDLRDRCYSKCDEALNSNAKPDQAKDKGFWTWVPEKNKVAGDEPAPPAGGSATPATH